MDTLNYDPASLAMNSKPAEAEIPASGEWVIEPKYDGIRLLIHVGENGAVRAFARSGKSKTGKLPDIESELAANLPAGTWVDGEAVAFNADGTQDWGGASSVLGSDAAKVIRRDHIRLVVFDLLAYNGTDTRSLPLRDRRELLQRIFDGGSFNRVLLSQAFPIDLDIHEAHLALGFEGSMIKNLDAPYESGKRSKTSLKWKATDTVDAVITGFNAAEPGSWIEQAGMIGTVTFEHYLDGDPVEGRCSGMDTAIRRYITDHQAELLGTVVEVSYMTRMPGTGMLRHPQFKRLRDDKTAAECRA